MRKLFAVSLLALLLGVGVVALIESDPGYVLVSYDKFTLETSLWVGLVVLAVALFIVYLIVRLVYRLLGGRRSLVNWFDNRRSSQAVKSTNRGVISFMEGDWTRARRQLLRGVQKNDAPLINYLLAAAASDHLEEPGEVAEFLQAARSAVPSAEGVVDIIRAQNKLRAGEFSQAQEILEQARNSPGRHPRVLGLLQQAYEGQGEWDKLLALLPDLRKHKQVTDAESEKLEQGIQLRRLQAAGNTTELNSVWQGMSTNLKQASALLQMYIGRLLELGDHAAAEKSIQRALKRNWDSTLVSQYGLLDNDNAAARLSQAERWLNDHPEDAQLLLCLGRLCLRESLWGKARDYFESSYRAEPGAEVCAELGRLLMGLGEPKVAAAYYREGLANTEAALPDLPMPDKVVANHYALERSEA